MPFQPGTSTTTAVRPIETRATPAVTDRHNLTRPAGQLHRTVALLTVTSLFLGTLASFATLTWQYPWAGIMIMVGYGFALALGVLALAVRSARAMLGVDIGILVCALLVRAPAFLLSLGMTQVPGTSLPYSNDEGALVDLAGLSLRAGVDPYTVTWLAAHVPTQPGTPTMTGSAVDRFDYTPVSALLSALSRMLVPDQPSAAIAGAAGLLAGTILLFVLLPAPWRSASTMICLGLGLYLMPYAREGYPEVMALPFVIVAANRWARIGEHGRLGALGISSAIGLGLGCATHQMVWFLVPFLVVGLFLVRLGDQARRTTWLIVGKYLGVALAAFTAVNAPFAVWNFHAWSTAVVTPLAAQTVPHGEGLVSLTYSVIRGSSTLQFFSYASAALAVGLLSCFALFIRRLGPAATILPWLILFVSIRSSDRYFFQMAPVWLMSVATVRHRDFARAAVVRLAGWHPSARRCAVALAALGLLAPAVILSARAVTSSQPLRMRILAVVPSTSSWTNEIDVQVTNVSDTTISPHFALSNSLSMSQYWIPMMGPTTIKPGQTFVYVLSPPVPSARRSLLGPRILLRAVSGYPETLSSVAVPMTGWPVPGPVVVPARKVLRPTWWETPQI